MKVTVSPVDARDLIGFNRQKSRLYAKFSAPVKEDCKISVHEEEEYKQSYYVNKGHVVQCLKVGEVIVIRGVEIYDWSVLETADD